MTQLGLFPVWENFENLYTDNYLKILYSNPPSNVFDAYWIEEPSPDEAKRTISRLDGFYFSDEWLKSDIFISYRRADRFVCVRRLVSEPLEKPSELLQLDLDRLLLWKPEATERDVKSAKALTARMRAAGRGNFHWHRDLNDALWVKRVTLGSC